MISARTHVTLHVVTSVSNWLIRTRSAQIHFIKCGPKRTWNSKDLSLPGLSNHISNRLFVTFHFWRNHICRLVTWQRFRPPGCHTLCPSSRPVWPCSGQRFARDDNDTRVRLGVFVLLRGRGESSCWVSRGRAGVKQELHLILLSFYITLPFFIFTTLYLYWGT